MEHIAIGVLMMAAFILGGVMSGGVKLPSRRLSFTDKKETETGEEKRKREEKERQEERFYAYDGLTEKERKRGQDLF